MNNNLSNMCLNNVTWMRLNKNGLIEDPNIRLNNKAVIYIYQCIKNKSKIYIGSTANLIQRFYKHRYKISKNSKSCPKFYNCVSKYGWNNFRVGVLEYIDLSEINTSTMNKFILRNKLLEREQFYFNILKPTLNINKIAGSTLGFKHT